MMQNTNGPFGEWRGASTAVGQSITAGITAATAFQAFPTGSQYLEMVARNFSTGVAVMYAFNPWLRVLKTTDGLATATDYSEVAQNNKPVTGAVVLSSFATTHALWIGAAVPFRGVFADVQATNTAASTIAATFYSSTGPTMTTLSISDTTIITGSSMQQDGSITWTPPADWTMATLRTAGGAANAVAWSGDPLYWVRFTVSAAFDSSTTLDQLLAMNRSTNYASLTAANPIRETILPTGRGRWGCIEARTDAVTASLVVNVATIGDGSRFPIA